MFRAVVFIACLAAALLDVHCLKNICYDDYDMKRIGLNTYCYRMHAFTRHHMPLYGYFWNVTEGDQHYCEYATQEAPARASSISIRNRKEYEFVKVEYRSADLTSTAQPMLIGLKYENDRFHWFDKSTFNYSGFLEPFYKSRFYMLKKGQCRRFFMYSPPTYGRREYFVFDINCKIRFFEYRVLCRYQIPAADLPKPSPQPDDYTQVEQTTQEFLDYYDYWADDLKAEENTEKISTTTKTSQQRAG